MSQSVTEVSQLLLRNRRACSDPATPDDPLDWKQPIELMTDGRPDPPL